MNLLLPRRNPNQRRVLGQCSLAPHTTAVPTLPARAQAALPSLPQEPAFGGDEMCWFIPAQNSDLAGAASAKGGPGSAPSPL